MHELDPYNGFDDIDDDVMEEETAVGDEEGNKCHQVGVDPWVHEDLEEEQVYTRTQPFQPADIYHLH